MPGFKTFVDLDILTAAEVNGFLMTQAVMVFDDATARGIALPSPLEGMVTYLKDTNGLDVYLGSAWVAHPGIGVVTTKGDLLAATAGDTVSRLAAGNNEERLIADSAQATGLKYVPDTTNYAIAAKGDLLAGTAADTLAAVTVGMDGQILYADSTQTAGVRWDDLPAPTVGASIGLVLALGG